MPLLTVVIPTIPGREESLRTATQAILDSGPDAVQVVVVRDSPSCGWGWREGAARAEGDYIALSCDDVDWLPGWWEAAVETCDLGRLPAPLVVNPDGSTWATEPDGAEVSRSVAPFLSRAQLAKVGPLIPTHYFCDDWVSWRARLHGIPTVMTYGYSCVSRDEQHGKTAESVAEAMARDRTLYERYCNGSLML